jgi:hypothetical protein
MAMGIVNEMERLVWEELSRVWDAPGSGYTGCRCSLCEMDIVALALTLLPPLYCRDEGSAQAAAASSGKIADAVQAALKRVSLWPKHRPGVGATARDQVGLVNYTFEVGTSMVGAALGQSSSRCDCERCRTDALAYALNRYPAKYGVTRSGRRSLHPTYLNFMRYELGMLISQAARVVGNRPNH